MIFLRNRLTSSFWLGMVLLSLTFTFSCQPTNGPTPNSNYNANTSTTAADPRAELVRSIKGANVDGFHFASREDDNQVITSLTNGALRSPVKIEDGGTFVLGYANVKDKKANTTKTLEAEIVRSGAAYSLHVKDIATGGLVLDERFAPRICPGVPVFNTLDECFDDFDCKVRPELLCEANRTCKNIYTEVQCCLRDGTRIHALVIIRPTARRCVAVFPLDVNEVLLNP
jgi:hypothetical protein